jgi:plasmid maintenance system antidote protein VapI
MAPDEIALKIKNGIPKKTKMKDAAKLLGVSAQYLTDMTKARRRLSAKMAVKLRHLGVDGDLLYMEQAKYDLELEHENDG